MATALSLLSALPASAATLAIDPTQSFLKLEILLFDSPIAAPQVPGSDRVAIGGTLEATFAGGQINFTGGSSLDFLEFDDGNTDLLPVVGGGSPGDPGTGAPADIGLDIVLAGLGSGPGAVRSAVADITGGPLAVVGSFFNASALTLGLTAGSLDVNLTTALGDIVDSVAISGNSAVNANASDGYTAIVGGMRYVSLPISLDVILPVAVGTFELPIQARFTGKIVTVPEPSSLALCTMAGVALAAAGYRRFRPRS